MSTLATLDVKINANTTQVNKAISGVKQSFNGLKNIAVAAVGAIAAAFTAKKLISTFQDIRNELDEIAKTASELGLATEVSIGFGRAAKRAGVSTQEFNDAMRQLQRRTFDAIEGTGEASKTLIKLGIDAEKFSKIPLEDKIKIIADKIASIKNPAEQAAVAYDLFGRSGQRLLNLLKEGTTGLQKNINAVRILGGAFKNIDLKKVEEMNDAIEDLKMTWKFILFDILIKVSPVLKDIAENFSIIVAAVKKVAVKELGDYTKDWKLGLDDVLKVVEQLAVGLSYLEYVIRPFMILIDIIRATFASIMIIITTGIAAILKAVQSVSGKDFETEIAFLGGALENEIKQATEITKRLKKNLTEPFTVDKIKKFFDEIRKEAKKIDKELKKERPFRSPYADEVGISPSGGAGIAVIRDKRIEVTVSVQRMGLREAFDKIQNRMLQNLVEKNIEKYSKLSYDEQVKQTRIMLDRLGFSVVS